MIRSLRGDKYLQRAARVWHGERRRVAHEASWSDLEGTSKTMVLLRENMVFGGLGAPRSSKSDPEDLIWEVFGDLGEHFGGLGGSWEQVGILMKFETLPGGTQVEMIHPG